MNDRTVIISKDDKDYIIKINDNTTLNEFKNTAKQFFKIDNNIKIHYFNNFTIKKIIKNEIDFKNSLIEKVFKYYFTEENIINNNNQNNINIFPNTLNNPSFINNYNNNMKKEKQKAEEIIKHLSSIALTDKGIKEEDYINCAVHLSYIMNQININEQKQYPYKFNNPKKILKYPGLISNEIKDNDYPYLLSLISEVLGEKGINASVYKDNEGIDQLDGAFLQYLFSGLTEKKKYEILFDLGSIKNNILCKKDNELNNFIKEWKLKISNKLNININDVILVNPKDKNGLFSLDLVSNETNITYDKLKNFKEIKNIEKKCLIEGCQLNSSIFDPKGDNQDGGWAIGEERGGEKYIPPLGWKGYGLKVKGKYDNGNNTWLSYNQPDSFAVAYFGISNIYGNKNNLNHFLNEINSQKALNSGYEQSYKNDKDLRNPFQKCGNGIYLFQDPKIAENTAGIIDISGVRYKILLMCRINPKKIRQPEGFKNCWILNSTPSEIRPYRILVKKIYQSAMAKASQDEIKIFNSPPKYYQDIIKQKDTSFFSTNNKLLNDYEYVIKLYTSSDYTYINGYLRDGIIQSGKYTEKQIKSWVWCLHNALTKNISNVANSTIYYRGVSRKFPENLGVGAKFNFGEFISVSEDKNVALGFSEGKTLFIIRIENNIAPNFYCYNIANMSIFKSEREILITSNCTFQITKKESKNMDKIGNIDTIFLTCQGYKIKI